jgi:hypothetical protein
LPQVRYGWLLELNLHRMEGCTDLKAVVIVFIGKDKFEMTEYK